MLLPTLDLDERESEGVCMIRKPVGTARHNGTDTLSLYLFVPAHGEAF